MWYRSKSYPSQHIIHSRLTYMKRAGILTRGVVAFILLAMVCIPQYPSSSPRIYASVGPNSLWFDGGFLAGDIQQASKRVNRSN